MLSEIERIATHMKIFLQENVCQLCPVPLNNGETVRGYGDGRGNKFVHESCYWRQATVEAKRLLLRIVENGLNKNERKDSITYINKYGPLLNER